MYTQVLHMLCESFKIFHELSISLQNKVRNLKINILCEELEKYFLVCNLIVKENVLKV